VREVEEEANLAENVVGLVLVQRELVEGNVRYRNRQHDLISTTSAVTRDKLKR